MPTEPLPTAAIWDGYAVAGIVFIVVLVMIGLIWKGFQEYRIWQTAESKAQRDWQDEQFKLREAENERQRAWNEQIEAKREASAEARDQRMRQFMQEQHTKQIEADRETSKVLNSLVARIDNLTAMVSVQTTALTEHGQALKQHDAHVDERLAQYAGAKAPRKVIGNAGR